MEPSSISALVFGAAGRTPARVPGAPHLSTAAVAPLREIAAVDERGAARTLHLPVERPLTILIDGREVVTLMTLGAAPEWLVLGYLRNQRLIDEVADVRSVEVDWQEGLARVVSRQGEAGIRHRGQGGAGAAPLGCGLGTVFADVMRRFDPGSGLTQVSIAQSEILDIVESMRNHDAIHRSAGSVHSCALFQRDELWVAVEDVSRHNAIDTITGFMILHGVAGPDKNLFTTGRLSGEMVMKAAHNGVPVMISRNGATAMGYDLAVNLGMTLIGRAASRRYTCYTGADRIARDAAEVPAEGDGGVAGPLP